MTDSPDPKVPAPTFEIGKCGAREMRPHTIPSDSDFCSSCGQRFRFNGLLAQPDPEPWEVAREIVGRLAGHDEDVCGQSGWDLKAECACPQDEDFLWTLDKLTTFIQKHGGESNREKTLAVYVEKHARVWHDFYHSEAEPDFETCSSTECSEARKALEVKL